MVSYDEALNIYRAAASKFHAVRVAYRNRKVGDSAFNTAVIEYKLAEAAMDEAESKERGDLS